MDIPGIITLISIFTLIRLLFGILADAPKALETISKAWDTVREGWRFVRTHFRPSATKLVLPAGPIRSFGRALGARLDMREPSPTPRAQNISIAPPCGALRINVFDSVNLGGSASCSATLS
jgi:hypothetical protein